MVIKILAMLGKTCSGKDVITNKLVKEYNFKKILRYTTRPIRSGEIPDITYIYVSENEFKKNIEEDFFAEWETYITKDGIWYYGTSKESLGNIEKDSVIILSPSSYRSLLKNGYNLKSIYIYTNNQTIKNRISKRMDDKEEANRRIATDMNDFKGIEQEVDKIVYNNDGTSINDVVNNIISCLEKMNERGVSN